MAEEEQVEVPVPAAPLAEDALPVREEFHSSLFTELSTAEAKFRAGVEKKAAKDAESEGGDGLPVAESNLVYGELGLKNLCEVLNCCKTVGRVFPETCTFVDCGSGLGKQVLGAAVLEPKFAKIVGIELLEAYDSMAQQAVAKYTGLEELPDESITKAADVSCVKGNFIDEAAAFCTPDNQVLLAALSPCYSEETLTGLCEAAKNAQVGSLLVTLTRAAPDITLWEPLHIAPLECPWGIATMFVQEKIAMPPAEE
ncbi:unnamed protein product [Amoebophrya sp. A120]|nr:unnamed protein product [Amoebophrya sp. A120]|eukprot:GSA120T00014919001.1